MLKYAQISLILPEGICPNGKKHQKFIICSLSNGILYRDMDEEIVAQRGKRRPKVFLVWFGFFNQKLNWEAIESKHALEQNNIMPKFAL